MPDWRNPLHLNNLLGKTGLVGGALSFVQIMRELSLDEIQRQLAYQPRLVVTAADFSLALRLADLIEADPDGPPLTVGALARSWPERHGFADAQAVRGWLAAFAERAA